MHFFCGRRIDEYLGLSNAVLGKGSTDSLPDLVLTRSFPAPNPHRILPFSDQQVITGTVATIAEKAKDAGITRSALLIVGKAVQGIDSGYQRSHLYS
jgi:precorrin-4/cobalt-precorrin-4 C11-methyltransferase